MKAVEMKAETERVRTLLMDTVVLLCKNGLRFEKELKVEGLIGITVDTDVFLVHINEQFSDCNEQVVLKQENSSLNYDKSVTLFSQSDQASRTQNVQQRTMTSTFQQSHEFIDCDEGETFDGAVKEEMVDYDDGDRRIPSKYDDSYNRYSHSEASLIGSAQENTFQRSLPRWTFLNHGSNNDDSEVNDVTDNGLFMSAYANSSASYAQQQPLRHLDEQVQHTMDSDFVHWTDTSQFPTPDRLINRPAVNRSHPVVRKRRTVTRGRGRINNACFRESKPEPMSSVEWLTSSEYTMPSVQARTKTTGRGGLRAKVETQASDGFSYGKLTVTKYVCNICGASYKHQCNLLTHQVRVHGRQKKKTGRRPKNVDPDDDLGPM